MSTLVNFTLIQIEIKMDRINLGYSLKNIPIPNKQSYLKNMVSKVESFIKRMRWNAYHFEKNNTNNERDDFSMKYGFKTEKCPPQNNALIPFENDLFELVHSIKFRTNINRFQHKLKKDIKEINNSSSIFVPADKTTNLYKVSKENYEKLLKENITVNYKKADISVKNNIDREAKVIANKLNLADRIECYNMNDAFITFKDHKENFVNNPKCRLINPAKSEIGVISKHQLQSLNNEIREFSDINQWRSTSAVISWFNGIENKNDSKFVQFDIVEFYPSISKDLLLRTIDFAKNITNIDNDVLNIIMHSRKSLISENGNIWIKKNESDFDVTMGSYDGAEICELVGLYLLNNMKEKFEGINFGLYRDDGLGCYRNMPGPYLERLKKSIISFFHDNGLKITIDTNLHQVNFLDVTFDLSSSKYFPYRKDNDNLLYINKDSNHPPSIIKNIPSMIEKRLSDLSCNEEEFDKAKPIYNKALSESGFPQQIKYNESLPTRRNRRRNILWFNPPFNIQTETNIGKEFLRLIDKHFPIHHKFRSIFNRNTVKISYSCLSSIKNIISKHNKKLLKRPDVENAQKCNCVTPDNCPLNGMCLSKAIVYKANVPAEEVSNFYFGLTEPAFKFRYNNHISSFNNREKRTSTSLAKHVWDIKDKNMHYDIDWEIIRYAAPRKSGSRTCDLCLSEKVLILQGDTEFMLNKRSEILNKCRHGNKFKLISVK